MASYEISQSRSKQKEKDASGSSGSQKISLSRYIYDNTRYLSKNSALPFSTFLPGAFFPPTRLPQANPAKLLIVLRNLIIAQPFLPMINAGIYNRLWQLYVSASLDALQLPTNIYRKVPRHKPARSHNRSPRAARGSVPRFSCICPGSVLYHLLIRVVQLKPATHQILLSATESY